MAAKTTAKVKASVDAEIFAALRGVMASVEKELRVQEDSPKNYSLVTKSLSHRGGPMWFGAVVSKSYVSLHFMPIYFNAPMLERLSPELRKRMQGKSCFNFKKMDEGLFAELRGLMKDGVEAYRKRGWL